MSIFNCQEHSLRRPLNNLYSWFAQNSSNAIPDASSSSIGSYCIVTVDTIANQHFKYITVEEVNNLLGKVSNCRGCIKDLFFQATQFLDSGSEAQSTIGALLYAATAYDRSQKIRGGDIEPEEIRAIVERALANYQNSRNAQCLHSLIEYRNIGVINYLISRDPSWPECSIAGCMSFQLAQGVSGRALNEISEIYGNPRSVPSINSVSTTSLDFQKEVQVGRDFKIAEGAGVVIINGVRVDIAEKLRAVQQSNVSDEYRQKEHQLYIDSFCVLDPSRIYDYSQAKPLRDEFEAFMQSDRTVFLLMASAGCGKTMFLQQVEDWLFVKLSQDPNAPIPLRIELSGLKDPISNAVQEGLINKGFTENEIEALKHKQLLIILDGVDEARYEGKPISQLTKLYLTNKLYLWKNAKIVFGTRIGGGSEREGHFDQFYPYANDSRGSVQSSKLHRAVICPFSDGLMKDYLAKYTRNAPSDWKEAYPDWIINDGEKYLNEMKRIKGYEELTSFPFTLRVIAEVLPGIIQDGHMTDITKSMLYEAYINAWINREEAKLDRLPDEMEDAGLAEWTWDYCMHLAAAMRSEGEGVTKVIYRPRVGGANASKWEPFFGNSPLPRTCLRAAPIRKMVIGSNWEFSFYHQRLLEYLYTRKASLEQQ